MLKEAFCELKQDEMQMIDGGDSGSWGEVFEKINPLNALEFVYQMGQDFGAASVKFGRECYDFYRDVKEIF